jgi:methyl-accepting chemotaxis protein
VLGAGPISGLRFFCLHFMNPRFSFIAKEGLTMSPGRLSIAQRAVISFGLIALLVLLQGLFALKQVAEVRATGQYTENISLPSTRYLGKSDYALSIRVLSLRAAQPRPQGARGHEPHQVQGWLEQALNKFTPLVGDYNREPYEKFVATVTQYRQALAQYETLSRENPEEMTALLNGKIQVTRP